MRINQPVSQREHEIPDEATLMSTTDIASHVTYANAAFVAASGFDRDELLGQPHNVVRHPDMPREAFADLWATLKAGHSWSALVKNRRKNGDHYWVRANAAPVWRGGELTGYLSVRTKPARQEIEAAEALYRRFREGRAGKRRFHQGLVVRTGLMRWASWPQTLATRWRLRWCAAGLGLLAIAAAAVAGLNGPALAAFAAAMMLMSLAVAALMDWQVSRPLELLLRQAMSVAAGRPDHHGDLNRVDEIGMALRAVNQAGLNLRALADDVGLQVGGLRSASSEIAQGNGDLSARTEQTAASLQQTAGSMAQMTSALRSNADTAREAAQLAGGAVSAAAEGGAVVGHVVETMREISACSKRVADIIGVIDTIAFQTNILALNAAVEAARAGEQGRGFAVVAAEVRGLAQRSAQAAQEIKVLIDDSVRKVEGGAQQVDHAGQAMGEIVSRIGRVNELIGHISTANGEQSDGIGQVSVAVSQLDRMTQQNATLVEQTAAAADAMRGQADRLVDAVAVFRR